MFLQSILLKKISKIFNSQFQAIKKFFTAEFIAKKIQKFFTVNFIEKKNRKFFTANFIEKNFENF